jgi:hypothetical protein
MEFMAKRHSVILLAASILASMGASYRTPNFLVEAPTPQIAEQVGQWAEYYRKDKANQWIGREMPAWSEPCPLRVNVTQSGAGGATTFDFRGNYVWQRMHIEGPLDRLLASVLPHEITHTVFAHYFRRPVPRWADEGGAVLSEDDQERTQHDLMVRRILNAGKAIPLARLFGLTEYPHDVGALYAEGFSVANFLVDNSNRKTFLDFVAYGMTYGWDGAAQTYFRYTNVNQLEQAWIDSLRKPKRQQPTALIARNDMNSQADPANRVLVRLTAPPVQPLQEERTPVYRAQAPETEHGAGWSDVPRQQAASRDGYLPEFNRAPDEPSRTFTNTQQTPGYDPWRPAARLGAPQFDQQPATSPRGPTGGASPVGYPSR